MNVAIIDYGMGNLNSVAKAFESLGVETAIAQQPAAIRRASHIVLPGVGAFAEGMKNLRALGWLAALEEAVLRDRTPFLGICLGMQLLAAESHEHGRHAGLGWIPGTVQPFNGGQPDLKSLHIGWNAAAPTVMHPLFDGLGDAPQFYFVHGYHLRCQDATAVCATSVYGQPFVSAVQQRNICGVQFHPEKSQETGLRLLMNFLRWDPAVADTWPSADARSPARAVPQVRLIPTLLLHEGRLVKTQQFRMPADGLRRDVGDPIKAPMVYDAQLADELIYLDIRASLEGRGVEALRAVVGEVAGQIFMPLTAGGGVRSLEDIRGLLQSGADKVAINTAAIRRPAFVTEAAQRFGSQCIVVAVDARDAGHGRYEVMTHSGTRATGLDPVVWAQRAEQLGAGEIFLTAIERDGMMTGYDLALIRRVVEAVNIPVIASGGAGRLDDLLTGIREGGAAAIATASLFHFRDVSPIKAKAFLRRAAVPVRH